MTEPSSGTRKTGGHSAAGKARQRERNKAAAEVTGIAPSRAGSSGIGALMRRVEHKEWADIEDVAEHVADFVASVTGVNGTAVATFNVTLTVPGVYAHETVDAWMESLQHFAFFRMYIVPRPSFIDDGDEPDTERSRTPTTRINGAST